jgi:hypothetical protein
MRWGGIVLFIGILALASCNNGPDEFLVPDSSYGLIYDHIFTTSCALSGCHLEPEKKRDPAGQSPFLNGEDAYSAIMGTTPANSQAAGAGLKLILAGDPDQSFLYQKIIYDSSAFQFGARMPSGGISLTADQIAFIRQWIVAGAPFDGHVADRSLIE